MRTLDDIQEKKREKALLETEPNAQYILGVLRNLITSCKLSDFDSENPLYQGNEIVNIVLSEEEKRYIENSDVWRILCDVANKKFARN